MLSHISDKSDNKPCKYIDYFLVCWNAWKIIGDHVDNGIFNLRTKCAASFLVSMGSQSNFIKALANGNVLFPDDVILSALEFEKMDKML